MNAEEKAAEFSRQLAAERANGKILERQLAEARAYADQCEKGKERADEECAGWIQRFHSAEARFQTAYDQWQAAEATLRSHDIHHEGDK